MKLLILFGPPAVGKTTVGECIEKKTTFKLFHNHMIMEGVMHLFGVGTKIEDEISREFRSRIFEEAAAQKMDIIFTYVWDFSKEKGKTNIDHYKRIYELGGGTVIFAELAAGLSTRMKRADSAERKIKKSSAPRSTRVKLMDTALDFKSPIPFFSRGIQKVRDGK